MTVYIGVDFHPYEQSVAWASDEDGEIAYRRFLHSDKKTIKAFYGKFGEDAQIGAMATTEVETLLVNSRLQLFDHITEAIKAVEARLAPLAEADERARLLMTHPGVGVINALALVHTLGDVRRFRRKEEVVAFVGLDPLEKSSGEKKRIGSISKHGSRLVRHLLGQAAQASRDHRIRKFYLEVSRRRGRPKAKVAAARKLLIHCYLMLRDGIAYEEFQRRGEAGLCEGSGEVNKRKLICTASHLVNRSQDEPIRFHVAGLRAVHE